MIEDMDEPTRMKRCFAVVTNPPTYYKRIQDLIIQNWRVNDDLATTTHQVKRFTDLLLFWLNIL
jgi:hypothetical protein